MRPLNNLRNRFERFCFKNRDKGIPNLMLYIAIGSGIVYLMSMFNGGAILYQYLCFDKAAILKGQVWRLFTYVFTHTPGNGSFLTLIFLYFFYNLGRSVEQSMGTFRFNLYYFSGVILMDVFAIIFCPTTVTLIDGVLVPVEFFTYYVYSGMAFYLHLSLLLTFAVTHPNSQFLVLFIIPVKAWFMGIVYLFMVVLEIYNMSYPTLLFPHNLFPLVATANFLLFAGKDVSNLFPFLQRMPRRRRQSVKKAAPIQFHPASPKAESKQTAAFNHRCTVCGRTDISHPDLEFRYCSRCNGYFCYCQDHINNHTHVE